MRKLTVLQTLKGSRMFDIGESFSEGTKEFAELEPETGFVKITEFKPAVSHPVSEPEQAEEPVEKTGRKRK